MPESANESVFVCIKITIEKIDAMISAIEAVIEILLQKRELASSVLSALEDNLTANERIEPCDSKLESFKNALTQFADEKEYLLELQRQWSALGEQSKSCGSYGALWVRNAVISEQTACLKRAEGVILANMKRSEAVIADLIAPEHDAEMKQAIEAAEEFAETARVLLAACYQAVFELEQKKREYETCDGMAMQASAAFGNGYTKGASAKASKDERQSSARESDRHDTGAIPPVCAASSAPTFGHNMPDAPASAPKQSKTKGSLFGFFRRKNKPEAQTNTMPSPPCVDSVQFAAVAPAKVIPGRYLPINIVMYEEAFRRAVDEIIQSHGENAKESKSGYHDVRRNSRVKVCLASRDVVIDDGEQEQMWNGKYLNFEFAARITNDFLQEQILFTATIYINEIIATKLTMILDCEKKSKRNISVSRKDFVSAFVSYASQDRNRVAAMIQGMQKARPDMNIFFDIESLRSGQKWEEVLKSEIDSRDVLFLCWSRYAKESKWVDMEWRYALQQKGEDGIEPIPIDSPDVCPPPIELQQKHFNDKMLYIIQATTPQAPCGQPCLLRVKTKERMQIDKPNVRIGRERRMVDLAVEGNATIGRFHAQIILRDGMFYIIDQKSTNHTYVDGRMISPGVETPIYHGAKIRLADEEFEFYY